MQQTILVAQIIVGIAVSSLILLQAKGVGLGKSLSNQAYHSRRGMEHIIFKATVVLSVIFVVLAVIGQFFV